MPDFVDLKVTTWNVDWLSCTNPEISQKDRELQIYNVVSGTFNFAVTHLFRFPASCLMRKAENWVY